MYEYFYSAENGNNEDFIQLIMYTFLINSGTIYQASYFSFSVFDLFFSYKNVSVSDIQKALSDSVSSDARVCTCSEDSDRYPFIQKHNLLQFSIINCRYSMNSTFLFLAHASIIFRLFLILHLPISRLLDGP